MGSAVIWAPLIMILVGWMFPSSLVWTLSQVPEVVVPVRSMVDGWWPAAPVRGEAVKEPLFDRLSLAGARGQVADGGVRPGFGGTGRELGFPGTGPVTVGAGQQGPGRGVGAVAGLVEPAADGLHGERGRVVLGAHRHPPLMGRGGVDAIGFGLARAGSGTSCTLPLTGFPVCHQAIPQLVSRPTSSPFFISTLITGSPAAR